MSINGFRTWQIATTTSMHFKGSYDAFRFNFKSKNLTLSIFEKRRDKYFFEKVAHKLQTEENVKRFVFANIFFANNMWIGDMKEDPYKEYSKRLQSFSYLFKQDLKKTNFNKDLNSYNGDIPEIIKRYLDNQIMAETVIAIDLCTGFLGVADDKVKDRLLWPEEKTKIYKARSFIESEIEKSKIKQMIIETVK